MSTITVKQYEAMVDAGVIGEHDEIELIEGYLVAGHGAVAAGPPCRRACDELYGFLYDDDRKQVASSEIRPGSAIGERRREA